MTKIRPFSNGTEFMHWHSHNCAACDKYENLSTERTKARCKFAFDIDLASVGDGEIPESTANWVGHNELGLKSNCAMKNILFGPAKFDKDAMNQLSLFSDGNQ